MCKRCLLPSIRQKVIARDKNKCVKCGIWCNGEVHHIKSVYKGGTDELDNLVLLCKDCHKCAPNDETKFGDYISIKLPPTVELSCEMTQLVYYIIGVKHGTVDFTDDKLMQKIYKDIEHIYELRWKIGVLSKEPDNIDNWEEFEKVVHELLSYTKPVLVGDTNEEKQQDV